MKILGLRPQDLSIQVLVSGKLNADTLKKGQEVHIRARSQNSLLCQRVLNFALYFDAPTALGTVVVNLDMQQQTPLDFSLLSGREQIFLDTKQFLIHKLANLVFHDSHLIVHFALLSKLFLNLLRNI